MNETSKVDPKKTSLCYCTALRKASRHISQMYDDALAGSGMKTTQRAILAQLRRGGPASVSTLAQALVMDAGGLAHTLKPLQRDGWVKIGVDPADRRGRVVALTRAGQAKLEATEAVWTAAQKSFESAFGKQKSAALREVMAILVSGEFTDVFERTARKQGDAVHA